MRLGNTPIVTWRKLTTSPLVFDKLPNITPSYRIVGLLAQYQPQLHYDRYIFRKSAALAQVARAEGEAPAAARQGNLSFKFYAKFTRRENFTEFCRATIDQGNKVFTLF